MTTNWPALLDCLEKAGPRLHVLLVRLTLSPHAAEDLLQDLFVRLATAEGFRNAADPAAFACRVAINLAFDWRKARQRRGSPLTLDPECPDKGTSPLAGLVEREELEQVLDAAGHLSDQSRDVFVLHYVQGESYESIAALLDKTPQQARGLAYKAVVNIRQRLAETRPRPNPRTVEA